MAGALRSFEHFTGTRVVVVEGEGTKENPVREVTYWFDEAGKQVAREDPADRPDNVICVHGVGIGMACDQCFAAAPVGTNRRQLR